MKSSIEDQASAHHIRGLATEISQPFAVELVIYSSKLIIIAQGRRFSSSESSIVPHRVEWRTVLGVSDLLLPLVAAPAIVITILFRSDPPGGGESSQTKPEKTRHEGAATVSGGVEWVEVRVHYQF